MLCTVSNHSFETCLCCRAGRYEVDGYVYNSAEEPKILMTGKWNESMNYQPCDSEGEPLPNTELQEVKLFLFQGDDKEFLSICCKYNHSCCFCGKTFDMPLFKVFLLFPLLCT